MTASADHRRTTNPAYMRPEGYEMRPIGGGMFVIGHPDKGYSLHRQLRELSYPLRGSTLAEATISAARAMAAALDVDLLFERPATPVAQPKAGKVYFIGGDVGAVKIGFAINPALRLVSLQCGSPIPLRILASAPAMPKDERTYHKRFKSHRLHGEWFERVPEIQAEIDRLLLDTTLTNKDKANG